jgi:hypothetical protein
VDDYLTREEWWLVVSPGEKGTTVDQLKDPLRPPYITYGVTVIYKTRRNDGVTRREGTGHSLLFPLGVRSVLGGELYNRNSKEHTGQESDEIA